MIASVHLATGAASALFVQNYLSVKYDWRYDIGKRYLFGFIAGLLSHIVFDVFPHAEYSLHGEALMAVLCLEGAVMMAVIPGWQGPVMAQLLTWGMIGAAVPDGLYYAGRYFGIEWLKQAHSLLHVFHGEAVFIYMSHPLQAAIAVASVVYVRQSSPTG